ncbi:DEAD/DEAH box helicase [Vibrio sp. SCSIO 43136]|uniref:DEAD/DEAH box helicase n=1 Tax=Vibrio sp. SCSIO 43136 TaxID=2819101 RepID=UPI002075BF01|nr:DEAD/DEAH box helicase [Vibrio sp. SCSIO 43136]USD65817.1 DEAD/DEAH box helicase [Vibrio sp. SCSIO 43136]
MSFSSLSLQSELIAALPEEIQSPTSIQSLVIPELLEARDIIAMANTGSGKTLAYGLPLLQMLKEAQTPSPFVQALILVPTRELAIQVSRSLDVIAKKLGIKSMSVCGGVDKAEQLAELTQTPAILVATTGRLLDLVNSGEVDLAKVKHLILDEADRLLDMGFWQDVQSIAGNTPNTRQTAMFSATFSDELKLKANQLLVNPKQLAADKENSVNQQIAEELYLVNKGSKANALIELIKRNQWPQALIFIGAKENADKLTKKLSKAGIAASALHGNKSQADREQTLADYKQGSIKVLIATDLLARGVDIANLPVVINFDLPPYAETYVHRVGRTARAGKSGTAISLVCHAEMEALNAIRTLTSRELVLNELEGFPVTDKPSSGESKRAPRDKKANRRTQGKKSIKQFQSKGRNKRS